MVGMVGIGWWLGERGLGVRLGLKVKRLSKCTVVGGMAGFRVFLGVFSLVEWGCWI